MVALLLLACAESPSSPTTCDVCRTYAVVEVAVRDSANLPVARAPILVNSYLDDCGGIPRGTGGQKIADSNGERRFEVNSLFSPHTSQCLEITVNNDGDPNFPFAKREFRQPVFFRADDGMPPDSVRLIVIVP